ncbi:methyl-accepting chemotaxis sensory transducer with Pas/Pac sensor [Candidatus Vecturithrix granuli]|uniref:Methyl-accepting chemotaxis sensory transducer with Pas/Pac sensor n=1 Tax=Vecturithrix granuli TaxID=1499967 RepID=A0A081C5K1_VECG1|nr:methyl-accepting chemotaxis sensory transducer with Pas/Pac sensor [Candidatus Vecturithrix granuli]
MNIPIKKSLSRRFSVIISTVVTLFVLAAASLLVLDNVKIFERSLEDRLTLAFNLVEKTLPSAIWNLDQELLDDVVEALFVDNAMAYVQILGNDKVLAAKTHPDFSAETRETLQDASRFLFRSAAVFFRGDKIGGIEIAIFKKRGQEALIHRILIILSLTFLLICAIVLSSFMITKRYLTRPLSAFIQSAGLIADGELGAELDAEQHLEVSQDEIGVLAEVFRQMVAYLKNMTTLATRISMGDLEVEIVPKSKNDVLGNAFQNMTLYLKAIAGAASAIADGDLRQNIQAQSDADILGTAFQKMAYLRRTVSQVVRGSEQLDQASEELKNMSLGMTTDMEHNSHQISVIASHSQQFNALMRDAASATAGSLSKIRAIADNSTKIASVATDAMNIASKASQSLTQLETRSVEIQAFIKVITEIAQQTNLLALNASIEAARAGELGKGFSVVANEVKELARGTARAVEDITQRVEAIHATNKGVSSAIMQLFQIIQDIHHLSTITAETIEDYALATNQIAHSVTDAAENSGETTQAIADVEIVSQHIVERANFMHQAAQTLTELAEELHRLVAQFQI